MANLVVDPGMVAALAADIEGIGSTVSAASTAATAPTTGLLAAAADEVSAAIANLFGAHGRAFQAVVGQAEAYSAQFQQTLAAAANAYLQTEVAAVAALQGAAGTAAAPAAAIPPFPANITTLFLGPTGIPQPSPQYVAKANELYVRSLALPAFLQTLYTPENLYPITGVKSMTLNQSVAQGLVIMDNAVQAQLAIPGNTLTIFGYSQSAIISSLYMEQLAAMGNPYAPSSLNFVLVGNEMNPNGGMLARFPGLTLPTLGLTFYGGTPSDTVYPTAIYTQEYDGFADFPRYPINFISDLNAVMGIATVHVKYLDLGVGQVDGAIKLDTSPGYTGVTDYYMIPTEELPLLAPLRAIPVIGNPLAALIEPNVEVVVNLGYGDPYHGYSTSPADVRTPFGLFPDVSPGTLVEAFTAGTQQGINDFHAEVDTLASQPITIPSFAPPQPADLLAAVAAVEPADLFAAFAALPSPEEVVNTVAAIISTDYAVLLPTADIALSLVTTLPLYSAQLFLGQLAQGNLINAIGYPIAAAVGLATIGGIVEFLVIASAISQNISAIESLLV